MIGNFDAKIIDYGVSVSSANRPQVFVVFEFEYTNEDTGGSSMRKKAWYGSLHEGAVPITLKSLIQCGLRQSNFDKLDKLADGPSSGLLDMERHRQIELYEVPNYQDESKTDTKIHWINDPALAPTIKKIDEADNKSFFGEKRGEFSDTLKALASNMDLPPETEKKKSKAPIDNVSIKETDDTTVNYGGTDEDIPF